MENFNYLYDDEASVLIRLIKTYHLPYAIATNIGEQTDSILNVKTNEEYPLAEGIVHIHKELSSKTNDLFNFKGRDVYDEMLRRMRGET